MNENFGDPAQDSQSGSSSSEEGEDEDAFELTEEIEKKFFKTLSCLKKRDPKIYNQDERFFEKNPEMDESVVKEKRKKRVEERVTLRSFEREMLLKNNGEIPEDDIPNIPKTKTYIQEQEEIKKSFKQHLDNESEESDSEIGGLFHEHKKSKVEKEKDEIDYKEWLKGCKDQLEDKDTEGEMKFLHDFWNDPNLDPDEKYLKDYILNKRFLEPEDVDVKENLVSLDEDENVLETQTQFEHKYNFRFEEPDQEFIKRYPRIMEMSLRRKDDRRKLKREAIRERKKEEKKQKIKELNKIRALKRQEIEDMVKKIKEATGNEELGFHDADIEKDFDPNEHDVQMQKLFSDEFYEKDDEEKPVFADDLDLEKYDYDEDNCDDPELYCEDADFNMDCDYTPEQAILAKQKKLEIRERRKKKRIKQEELNKPSTSAVSVVNSGEKPVYDKSIHKTFEKYLEEYYKLDCEDFIQDMPCRFKYRKVVPNSFGLSIEEILTADDKELNTWCAINKITQIRPDEVEKYDVKAFQRKAQNEELKRKVLPSLYKASEDNVNDNDGNNEEPIETSSKKKKKRKKKKRKTFDQQQIEESTQKEKNAYNSVTEDNATSVNTISKSFSEVDTEFPQNVENGRKKKSKNKKIIGDSSVGKALDGNSTDKDKKCIKNGEQVEDTLNNKGNFKVHNHHKVNNKNHKQIDNKFKKRHFNQGNKFSNGTNSGHVNKNNTNNRNQQTAQKRKRDEADSFYCDISDTRLKAYGIKPKKFKKKLKYGSVN